MLKKIPTDYFDASKGTLKLLWEEEWRGLGITQSLGWEHYEVHEPEPHILLFKRPINYQPPVTQWPHLLISSIWHLSGVPIAFRILLTMFVLDSRSDIARTDYYLALALYISCSLTFLVGLQVSTSSPAHLSQHLPFLLLSSYKGPCMSNEELIPSISTLSSCFSLSSFDIHTQITK